MRSGLYVASRETRSTWSLADGAITFGGGAEWTWLGVADVDIRLAFSQFGPSGLFSLFGSLRWKVSQGISRRSETTHRILVRKGHQDDVAVTGVGTKPHPFALGDPLSESVSMENEDADISYLVSGGVHIFDELIEGRDLIMVELSEFFAGTGWGA